VDLVIDGAGDFEHLQDGFLGFKIRKTALRRSAARNARSAEESKNVTPLKSTSLPSLSRRTRRLPAPWFEIDVPDLQINVRRATDN
jgi:hypothetical protein